MNCFIKKSCKYRGKLLDSGHLAGIAIRTKNITYAYMKKIFLAMIALLTVAFSPAVADDSVAVLAVKARANVLASALEMLSLDGADKYPVMLASGIDGLVKQMKVVEDIIDDLEETEVAEAEAGLAKSANFAKLKTDFRAAANLVSARNYYGCEELQDALEDLEDEIEDME